MSHGLMKALNQQHVQQWCLEEFTLPDLHFILMGIIVDILWFCKTLMR